MWKPVIVGSAVSIWAVVLFRAYENKMNELENMRDMKNRITSLERQMKDMKKQMK